MTPSLHDAKLHLPVLCLVVSVKSSIIMGVVIQYVPRILNSSHGNYVKMMWHVLT